MRAHSVLTPEMIAAGVEVYQNGDPADAGETLVADIWKAMEAARESPELRSPHGLRHLGQSWRPSVPE